MRRELQFASLCAIAILALATGLHPTTDPAVSSSSFEINCNSTAPVFHCDESTCVRTAALCNGIPECPEGQDESVQQCGCLPNEFRCLNSCVDIFKRCDRNSDCPWEEDERDCKTYLCPVTHFKCNNHFCIPLDLVCNFQDDCGDESDEIKCVHRKCWNPEFRCKNGECLRPGYLCDGHPDCKDGSDEIDCSPDKFVKCGDGTLKHQSYWCDDWPDCPDNHADELNCKECTGRDEYKCPNGRCISKANVCDSQCDCPSLNGTMCADEIDCDLYYTSTYGVVQCRANKTLRCLDPSGKPKSPGERCISSEYICDGINHCHTGDYISDEFGCKPNEFEIGNTFRCLDNRTLPDSLICDHKMDCLHGEDEGPGCPVPYGCGPDKFNCTSGQCIDNSGRCNVTFECWDKSDEIGCHEIPCEEGMTKCSLGGQCIPDAAVCDFFIDCPDGSDEKGCKFTNCTGEQFKCENGQCVDRKHKCFVSGKPREGCADNSHLRNCKDFQCAPGQFKCHVGKCLVPSLICNGAIDCNDTWEDEDGCPFACSITAPECECKDVHINCTGKDLTFFPDAEKEITWFHLSGNRLDVSLNNETLLKLDRLLYLDLSNNSISCLVPYTFRNLWRLTVLNLQNNRIRELNNGSFYGLPSVKGLHLQGNSILRITAMAFYGLSSLTNLDLHQQRIQFIEPDAFVGLRSLIALIHTRHYWGASIELSNILDLSKNEIGYLHDGTFKGTPRLLSLDLSDNKISVIDSNVFRTAAFLEKLITDEFRFCCLARDVPFCWPPQDEFSSCEDLMSNIVLRICVWALAIIATVGNVLVIACRARYKHCNQNASYNTYPPINRHSFVRRSEHEKKRGKEIRAGLSAPGVHSFLITNLAVGDLLMGSYLLLIAFVDWHYRGVYFIHDSTWRSSQLCSLAGFISTFSSELSVFTLTVITLDRFLVIIFPFRVRRLEMNRTKRLMAFGWVTATCISAIPLLHIDYFKNFYGRSGVCLALHITPDKPNGWEYSVFVFLFLNLLSFTIIAVGYMWMFLVARTTQHAVHKERRTSESAMAWRMTLLVATDAACWVPIIILGFVSLAGFTVPPQVFAWVAVFVLPLNAAVNPVLYTLSTAPFLTPARHGFLSFRRSCKMSLSQDHRRTFTSNLNHFTGVGSIELYSMTRRSMRNSLETSVTEQGVVLPLHHNSKNK